MPTFVIARIICEWDIMKIIDSFYCNHCRPAVFQIRICTVRLLRISPGNGMNDRIHLNYIGLRLCHLGCGIFRSTRDISLEHLFCRIIVNIYPCIGNAIFNLVLFFASFYNLTSSNQIFQGGKITFPLQLYIYHFISTYSIQSEHHDRRWRRFR